MKNFWKLTAKILFCLFGLGDVLLGQTLKIAGLSIKQDIINLSDLRELNPGVRRLTCPGLTEFNPKTYTHTYPLLNFLRKLNEKTWELQLKDGLHWWDGVEVTNADLESFLRNILVKEVGLFYVASIPKFRFERLSEKPDSKTLKIYWDQKPPFDLYFLSNFPFFRMIKNSQKIQCVGLFQPEQGNFNSLMSRAKSRFNKIILQSEVTKKCKDFHLVPEFSVIIWPKEVFSSAQDRAKLTELIPRGEFLRTLHGNHGDLVSGPISKSFLGYDSGLKVRPYRHSFFDGKKSLGLTFSQDFNPLDKKFFSDIFLQSGFAISENVESKTVFTTLKLLDLQFDLLDFLHSNQEFTNKYTIVSHRDFDKLLEDFRRSLSTKSPDFSMLKKIHREFFRLEPFTVLMQKQICLEFSEPKSPKNIYDPQWLREIVLE